MARLDLAGVQLGMLIGALDEEGGDVNPLWLLDPWGGVVEGLTGEGAGARRWRVGGVAKAILDGGWVGKDEDIPRSGPDQRFYAAPIVNGPPALNVIWTRTGAFELGLGVTYAKGDLSGTASAMAVRVSKVEDESGFDPRLDLTVSLANPVEFISGLEITADLGGGGPTWAITLTTSREVEGAKVTRRRSLDGADSGRDAARIVALVLATWVQHTANQAGSAVVWRRVADHLLPMLGEIGADKANYPIVSLWPFDDNPDNTTLSSWLGSLTDLNGLVTFLWHLRALLTGVTDPELFKGSVYAPLIAGTNPALKPTHPSAPPAVAGLGEATIWLKAEPSGSSHRISLCKGTDPTADSAPIHLFTISGDGLLIGSGLSNLLSTWSVSGDDLRLRLDQIDGQDAIVLSAKLGGTWAHLRLSGDRLAIGLGGDRDSLPALSSSPSAPQATAWSLRLLGDAAGATTETNALAALVESLPAKPDLAWLGDNIAAILGKPLKIPLKTTRGPLTLGPLWLTLEKEALDLGLDLRLDLVGFEIAARGLGARIGADNITPRLEGLGLRFEAPLVSLRGELQRRPVGDFQGHARLSVADTFALGAMAGLDYGDGKAAIYVFGALRAPLGGPVWCFVTGIAGGVGLNYKLPPLTSVDAHPFVQCLWGTDTKQTIAQLPRKEGAFWIAAGLTFTSFGLIEGLLIAAVQLNPFQIQLLGRAELSLKPLAFLRLDIGASIDAEKIAVLGGVNGYFIHPDLASLSGEFALIVWPEEGDFVLTVGGYHPGYPRPKHYPARDRLRMKSGLGPLHVEVTGYLALTPREVMVGASASIWGDFGVASAGLEAFLDAWIRWDPWFVSFRGGVCIWVDTWATGRFEVGVTVEVWTPKFGGRCEIDLTLDTIEIEFGSSHKQNDRPSFAQVLEGKLGLVQVDEPESPWLPFSTGGKVGVFGLDVTRGLVGSKGGEDDEQPGQSLGAPIRVLPEFRARIRTRLPMLGEALAVVPLPLGGKDRYTVSSELDSPLSNHCNLTNTMVISWWKVPVLGGAAERVSADPPAPRGRRLPSSLFGPIVAEWDLGDSETTVPGFDTFEVHVAPEIPEALKCSTTPVEICGADERYPLPQGEVQGAVLVTALGQGHPLRFGPPAPLPAPVRVARQMRETVVTLARGLRSTAAALPAGAVLSALPVAVTRRPELAAVRLIVVPPPTRRIDAKVDLLDATPDTAKLQADQARVRVLGDSASGELRLAGDQVVRVLMVSRGGRIQSDRAYQGSVRVPLSRGAGTVAVLGEGGGAGLPTSGPLTTAAGVEPRTRLVSLGGDLYVGVGCTLKITRRRAPRASEEGPRALAGSSILGEILKAELSFAAGALGSLVLRLRGPVGQGAPVEVRATGATLGALSSRCVGDELALVGSLRAPGAFSVALSLAEGWSLRGVIALPLGDAYAELGRGLPVDLIDDRMAARRGSTTITWEIQP